MKKPSIKIACDALGWLVSMCAPNFSDTVGAGRIPLETKIGWLRSPPDPLPYLKVDTSCSELYQLERAGILEDGGHTPTVCKLTAKGSRIITNPGYRLTELGRCWCIAAYKPTPGLSKEAAHERSAMLGNMLIEAMRHPEAIAGFVERHKFEQHKCPEWVALVLVGAGLLPLAAWSLIESAMVEHGDLIGEIL